MNRFLLGMVVVCAVGASAWTVHAANEKNRKEEATGSAAPIVGVLIDNKCGATRNEEQAAKHPPACAVKCADSGYQVVSGDKHLKLDDKGNELAKDYLDNNQKTLVTVEGTIQGDTLHATSIKPAPEKSGKESEKSEE